MYSLTIKVTTCTINRKQFGLYFRAFRAFRSNLNKRVADRVYQIKKFKWFKLLLAQDLQLDKVN